MSEETTENTVEETPPAAEAETENVQAAVSDVEAPAEETSEADAAPVAEETEATPTEAETPVAEETEATPTEAETPVAEESADEGEAASPAEESEAEVPAEEAPVAEADETTDSETAAEAEGEIAEATPQPVASTVSIADLKPAMELQGTVKRIELYGAFVDVGVGKDALLHISQLGKPNVRNVEDVVKKDETITVYVLKVDAANERIALSMEKPPERPINRLEVGEVVTGEVVRIENFGVFVEIGAERPGMIHVSELAVGFVKSPEDIVTVGGEVQAKIIKVNRKKRQIDLSIKALEEEQTRADAAAAAEDEDDEPMPTAMEMALRRAMDEVDETPEQKAKADRRQRNSRKRRDALSDALSRTLREHGD